MTSDSDLACICYYIYSSRSRSPVYFLENSTLLANTLSSTVPTQRLRALGEIKRQEASA